VCAGAYCVAYLYQIFTSKQQLQKIHMNGVIGVVVLHFPVEGLTDNIRSFLNNVDEVLLIDNSQPGTEWLDSLSNKKIVVIRNQQNTGIAAALNTAARYALSKNAAWLLTMDQDSRFEAESAARLVEFAHRVKGDIAICSPAYHSETIRPTQRVRFAMTSGSMLNLTAYKQCGLFDEKLFIDSVDHEYCLRLRKAGWKIVQTSEACLHHHPGNKIVHRLAGLKIRVSEHPASRHYYMARNRLVVMFRYLTFDPRFFIRELLEYPKQLLKIMIFEKDKMSRLKFMCRGVFHFLSGRFPDHA
jgi:rhamnosyltransferase